MDHKYIYLISDAMCFELLIAAEGETVMFIAEFNKQKAEIELSKNTELMFEKVNIAEQTIIALKEKMADTIFEDWNSDRLDAEFVNKQCSEILRQTENIKQANALIKKERENFEQSCKEYNEYLKKCQEEADKHLESENKNAETAETVKAFKFCTKCAAKNNITAKFCRECGAKF
ncbi:MAG: zinc ribbon domain-containing protein [Oscillospiraceae bacterium]